MSSKAKGKPEWRFHKSTGTGSNQNEDEAYFPCSVEWFYDYIVQQTGTPPNLQYIPTGAKTPITNISQLASTIAPGTGVTAGDPSWGDCGNGNIRITDLPEKIPGDRNGFPTYFHCYALGNGQVAIGYLLFYGFDYKGRYCTVPTPFGCGYWLEKGQHRGDWEGVNIVVSNVTNLADPASAQNATLEKIKFSGHGSPKYINTSPDPGYGCSAVVDCRATCLADGQFPVGTINQGIDLVIAGGILCLMPCHYPGAITITKPMTLKAPEGPATIGTQ